MSKATYIIPAIVVLVVSVGIVGWSFFGLGPSKPSAPQTANPSPQKETTLTGLEIAKQTATFLDTNMKPDGSFTWQYSCSSTNQATGSACLAADEHSAPSRSGYIALAYLDLFKKTQDPSYKEKALKVADYVLRGCEQDSRFCYWSFKPLYAFFKETGDTKYKDALLKVAANPLKEQPLSISIGNNDGHRLAILYEITGDKKYRDTLENMTKRILSGEHVSEPNLLNEPLYQEGSFPVRQSDLWAAWDFYLSAYKATQNEIYLKAAQDFFDKAKFSFHTADFKGRTDQADLNVLEALLDVAEVSSEPKKSAYQKQAYEFAQAVVTGLWDSSQSPKFTGDNGFLSLFSKDNIVKRSTHNGWRVSQFLRMSEQTFRIQ